MAASLKKTSLWMKEALILILDHSHTHTHSLAWQIRLAYTTLEFKRI